MMAITLSIYYLAPWLRWDRGPGAPNQAVLVDLAHERFYFFFIEIWPQEVYYITGLLILCGGCAVSDQRAVRPAVVRLFLPADGLDRSLHLGRNQDRRRPRRPHPARRRALDRRQDRQAGLQACGLAAVRRRRPAAPGSSISTMRRRCCISWSRARPASAIYAAIAGLTFTTYSLGGLMREQVCTYMCPWPRIQAAMTDNEALCVTYRRDRGEPRGSHKKGDSWDGRGSCIDCNQCVAACPDGHRHPRRRAARMHQLRAVHRRLRRRDGADRTAAKV